jgi:hypothetical protein
MKRSTFLFIPVLAIVTAAGVFSQTQTTTPTQTPVVDQREKNQEKRIDQGIKSGEVTKGEAARLEAQQGRIKVDEAKAKADGVVTPKERAKLTREQNRANRNIYRKKHNGRIQKP